jgi:PleD family two-component response regulator
MERTRGLLVARVGILIIDDDVVSQRALKNVLGSEEWRVRIVPLASHALNELASGQWNLVIVNVALVDLRGPLFAILKELAQADSHTYESEEDAEVPKATDRKHLRVLFVVPLTAAKAVQPALEREGLPYTLKPYHLHDILEKVSELLVESGAIEEPIRSIGDFSAPTRRLRDRRASRDGRRSAMFASREDYQMTEEEMTEFERQEEEERKKREKALKDLEHL